MTSPGTRELDDVHFNFDRTIWHAPPSYYVNAHNNCSYVTWGPLELTITTPADAYQVSETFLRMAREMEERQNPPAPLPPGHGENHIDNAGHVLGCGGDCAPGTCITCGATVSAAGVVTPAGVA